MPKPKPFHFYTQLHLKQLTGSRAATLSQLLRLLRELPGSAIYFHTHQFLQQYHLLTPQPPNDFAHWVRRALGDDRLAELLASIDTTQFSTIRALREALIATIEQYLKERPAARWQFAREGEEFHAIQAVSFIMPTPYVAHNLQEFREGLHCVTINSLYFHLFEARLRLGRDTNDFSAWLREALQEEELARHYEQLDPYTMTLEDLRARMLALLDQRLNTLEPHAAS